MAEIGLILARLMPRSPGLEPRGGRAADALSAADIAHALTNVRGTLSSLALQVKYLSRAEYTDELLRELVRVYANEQTYKQIQLLPRRALEALAVAALASYIDPPKCRSCHGRGSRPYRRAWGEVIKECAPCSSTGRRLLTAGELHTKTGLGRKMLSGKGMLAYLDLLEMLVSAEGRGARAIKRAMRRGD